MYPMQIPARLLIIALLAVALYLPTAIGQKPAIGQQPCTVSVRPRVTTPLVTVVRTCVPLGELVTFTLTPAGVVMSSRYKVTLYFGDGVRQVIRQNQIDYLYLKPAIYTYSILVEPSDSPTPTPTPPPPGVKLIATPRSVEIDRPVDFAAQLSRPYPNVKYRFVFADGSQTDWRDSPQTTHNYRSPGSYQAYVDIGLGNGSSVKQVGGSLRQAIEVLPPPRTIAVDLTANKVTIQAKDEVEFFARVDPSEPNITYRFDFGDGSGSTAWQASPRIKHVYSSSGTYRARVDVRVLNNRSGAQTASSKPLPIAVEPAPLPRVNLSVKPRSVLVGFPVYFNATTASANSNTRYRFNFGDGSSGDWKAQPEDTHMYSLAGNYPAFVEAGSAGNRPIDTFAVSSKKQVSVVSIIPPQPETPTPTPSPNGSPPVPVTPAPTPAPSSSPGEEIGPTLTVTDNFAVPNTGAGAGFGVSGASNNWWKYLLAALIPFAGYQGWKYFYAPRPTFVPHFDPGDSNVGAGKPFSIDFQMDLDPNLTGAEYTIDTQGESFIKSERGSDD